MRARSIKTNLVETEPSLVGRNGEHAAIEAFFADGARLVTLFGPGGMGKTRVATRFARERLDEWSSHGGAGVWFCDLTEAKSALAVCAAVGLALGLPLHLGTSEPEVVERLGSALARRGRLLLVLDNFEHLAADAGSTVGVWLKMAPSARFLVTSRVALELPGEQLAPLHGLSLPSVDATAEEIMRSESVELFLRRARQVRPDLPLPDSELRALAEIVRLLDGIPLAIELVAARVGVLSLAQLRGRWDRPLDLLVRSGTEGKHGSIRATVLDSVHLLDPATHGCLARCTIFRGGFSLASAEVVLAAPGYDVLRALGTLVRHSLLRVVATEAHASEPRFQLYDTIREVALELPIDRDRVALAHARYFAKRRLDLSPLDFENVIEAHRNALARHDDEGDALALELVLTVEPLLAVRGLIRLRLRMLDAALATGAGTVSDRAAAFLARGQAYRELGRFDEAREDFDRGLALSNDPALTSLGLMRVGELVETDGDTTRAREYFARALESSRAAPSATREAEIRAHIGHAWRREGQLDRASVEIARALALSRESENDAGIAANCYEAGVIALFHRRYDATRSLFGEGLVRARALGARTLEAALLSGLGVLVQEEGDLDQAVAHHASAVHAFRDLGNRHREGSALYYLAGAYLERRESAQALTLFRQSLDAVRAVRAPRYEALIESARGAALAMAGDDAGASHAFDAAERCAALCASEQSLIATIAIHRLHLHRSDRARGQSIASAHAGDDPQFALRVLTGAGQKKNAAFVVRDNVFHLPNGGEIDLRRRLPLQRILMVLARRRVEAPGDALTLDELIAAGWPGEKLRHDAAVNRLHVALTTLRKLGLRDILVSGEHGYLLLPMVPVVVEN